MADAQTENPSLSEQYVKNEKEEKSSDVAPKPVEAKEAENPENAASGSGDVVTEKLEETETPAPVEGSTEASPAAAEESTEANPAAAEESSEPAAEENSGDAEETPEIKLQGTYFGCVTLCSLIV